MKPNLKLLITGIFMLFVIGANAQIGAFDIISSCSSSCNGSVELRPLISLDGPLTLEITNVGGDFRKLDMVNTAVFVDHLCAGQYTVAIYKKGIQACVNTLSFMVPTEDTDFEITTTVEHIPVGQTVGGSIHAIAIPSGKYDYRWSTGKEEIGSETGSKLTNLARDWYRVHVQKLTKCGLSGKEAVVLLEACDNSFPLGVILKVLKNPSLNTADGEIEIGLKQACKQYQIQWMNNETQQIVPSNSTQGGCEISSSIVGLGPGNYTLIITDTENGCQLIKEYELKSCDSEIGFPSSIIKDFEVKIEHEIDEINNQIKARALIRYKDDANGFIPLPDFFTIYWTGSSLSNNSYYSREFEGVYNLNLNVSAIVSNGCYSHRADLRINDGGFDLDIKQACVSAEGEEYQEGEVAVTYKTTGGSAPADLKLKLLGDEVPNGEIIVPFTRTDNGNITTLKAKLKLRMGNYEIVAFTDTWSGWPEKFTVSSTRKSGGEFSHESDLVCYFNNPHCGTVGDILTRLPAMVIPINSVNSTAEMCAADIKCGGSVVKTLTASTKELIHWEYINLLWSLLNSPNYNRDYVWEQITLAKGVKSCAKLSFCPLTLKAVYHDKPGRSVADREDMGNCRTYECHKGFAGLGRETITICDQDLGDNALDALGGADFRCERVSYYISDLIRWYKEGWFASNSVFLNSPVANLVVSNLSRESELLCSTVSFCKRTYSELETDFNDCGSGIAFVYGPDEHNEVVDGTLTITAYKIPVSNCTPHYEFPARWCIKNGKAFRVPNQNNNKPSFAPVTASILTEEEVTSSLDSSLILLDTIVASLKAIKINQPNESLLVFGRVISDSISVPKGLVQTGNGMYFYEYVDGYNEVVKEHIGKIKYYVSNWDNDYLSTVEELNADSRYLITSQQDTLRWTNELKSDQYLSVDYFTQEDTILTISGQFTGQLLLNNAPIKQVLSPTIGLYILQTSTRGALLSAKYIIGVDSAATRSYSETRQGSMVFAVKSPGSVLEVENGNLNLGSTDRTAIFKYNGTDPIQVLQKFSLPAQAKLNALGWNDAGTECAALISGIDTLTYFEQETIGSLGNRLVLQVFDQNGAPKRSNYWKLEGANAGKFSTIYGQGNELFVGISFSDTLRWSQGFLKSRGSTDIALLKLDQSGVQKWVKQFGTVDQENISQLMYSDGTLFFGGEFDGSTRVRTIGNYDFVNAASFTKNVYISYVADSSAQVQPPVTTPELLTISPKKLSTKKGEIQVKIYPNPFQNEVSLQIDSDRSLQLMATLFNEIGRNVMSFNWDAVIGENQYTIPTSQLNSGFYFLQLRDNQGKLVQTHKIVKL